MKKFNLVLVALILLVSMFAQEEFIDIEPETVDFGLTYNSETYQEEIHITNNSEVELNLNFQTYNPSFSFETDNLNLMVGETYILGINFAGNQNIIYKDILVISATDNSLVNLIELRAENRFSDDYYSETFNLFDNQLKDALLELIDDHNSLGYNSAKELMFGYIDNFDDQVQGVYTGEWYNIPEGEMPNQNVFNCEHTWPQSYGAEGVAKSDLHHLFPTFATVNSTRGNLPFGIVQEANWENGGSKRGYDENNTEVFEPRDQHKGNCARAMFYFSLRYDNPYDFLDYQESTLREWSEFDLPDELEKNRNEEIFDEQYNRNPFVDHPGFLERIYSIHSNENEPDACLFATYPNQLDYQEVPVDSLETLYIAIANIGNCFLMVEDISISSDYFYIEDEITQISPNSFEEIPVYFQASTVNTFNSTIEISTNGGNVFIPMTATTSETATDEVFETNDTTVSMYTNPVSGVKNINFDIKGKSKRNFLISIYNIKGKRILTDEFNSSNTNKSYELSIDNMENGVYFYRIKSEQFTKHDKFIIIK